MTKRIISLLFACFLLLGSLTGVAAYDFPSAFWDMNTRYETAVNQNDYYGIIESGNQIINLMLSEPDCFETRNVLVSRYNQVGIAYAAIRDYDNAARTFGALYNYVIQYGDEFYDYVKSSKARVAQYTSEIKMYTGGGQYTYYGAVNEKENGVLFGLCSNGLTRSQLYNESMVLVYQELGQPLLTYNVTEFLRADQKGLAVEFALNCPRESVDIQEIDSMDPYLAEISDLFAQYPNVPIYLRFAAEFDIWTALADPAQYVYAFRHVSQYFKNRHTNVAMVWSPSQVSNWYIDIDDFYPGDQYVDWVGMSLYAQKYFLGDPNQNEEYQIVFKTGINSNPVIAVRDIVEKYGDRKPIMLSESGCSHTLVRNGEKMTDFALQRLREFYHYLPMVYPQIKLMAHFDWFVEDSTETYDYRLSSEPKLQKEYLKLVEGPRFIQDSYQNQTEFCYQPIADGSVIGHKFEVSCYTHRYNTEIDQVTYYLDGEYVGSANKIPYTKKLKVSGNLGSHTLKAIAHFTDGTTLETESIVTVVDAGQLPQSTTPSFDIDFGTIFSYIGIGLIYIFIIYGAYCVLRFIVRFLTDL